MCDIDIDLDVSKLFRAYGLYNDIIDYVDIDCLPQFQSSFELTGYITLILDIQQYHLLVSKLFRAYGLYNDL